MIRNKETQLCPFVVVGKAVKATATNAVVEFNSAVTSQTKNIIYCITCNKCKQQYVGQTERTLQARFSEHRDYAKKRDLNKVCGAHFSSRGHSVHDMKVSILEKVHSDALCVPRSDFSEIIRILTISQILIRIR